MKDLRVNFIVDFVIKSKYILLFIFMINIIVLMMIFFGFGISTIDSIISSKLSNVAPAVNTTVAIRISLTLLFSFTFILMLWVYILPKPTEPDQNHPSIKSRLYKYAPLLIPLILLILLAPMLLLALKRCPETACRICTPIPPEPVPCCAPPQPPEPEPILNNEKTKNCTRFEDTYRCGNSYLTETRSTDENGNRMTTVFRTLVNSYYWQYESTDVIHQPGIENERSVVDLKKIIEDEGIGKDLMDVDDVFLIGLASASGQPKTEYYRTIHRSEFLLNLVRPYKPTNIRPEGYIDANKTVLCKIPMGRFMTAQERSDNLQRPVIIAYSRRIDSDVDYKQGFMNAIKTGAIRTGNSSPDMNIRLQDYEKFQSYDSGVEDFFCTERIISGNSSE